MSKLIEFIKKAKEIHGDEYKYDKVVIENSLQIKVEIYCNRCQEYFWQEARNHTYRKWGHYKCRYIRIDRLEKFLKFAKKIHGDEYNYDKVIIDSRTDIKVEIWCNRCQEYFWQIAEHHYSGSGHNKCKTERQKQTFIKRYGTEHPSQNLEVRNRTRQTNLNRYGIENPLKNPEFIEKYKKTNLKRYGTEYPAQNPEIAEKQLKNAFKGKEYIFPSGKEIHIQGYEPFALNRLLTEEQINEEDIITSRADVPEIWWIDSQGKSHRYYVDIFIPSQNRCIEVKSQWTFDKHKENVFLKLESVKSLGYSVDCWIFDSKGELIMFVV